MPFILHNHYKELASTILKTGTRHLRKLNIRTWILTDFISLPSDVFLESFLLIWDRFFLRQPLFLLLKSIPSRICSGCVGRMASDENDLTKPVLRKSRSKIPKICKT